MPDHLEFGDLICYRLHVVGHDAPVMYLGHVGDPRFDLIAILPLTPPFEVQEKAREAWQLCTHGTPDA